MLLHCPSKKCNTIQDHRVKVDGPIVGDAICMQCGEVNNSVTASMKSVMRSNGDVYRSVAVKKAFMFKCAKCGIDRSAKVVNDQALCEVCSEPFKLTSLMVNTIKMHSSPDVEESKPKVTDKTTKVKRSKQ